MNNIFRGVISKVSEKPFQLRNFGQNTPQKKNIVESSAKDRQINEPEDRNIKDKY